jgi:hypothetical protein
MVLPFRPQPNEILQRAQNDRHTLRLIMSAYSEKKLVVVAAQAALFRVWRKAYHGLLGALEREAQAYGSKGCDSCGFDGAET